jgi:hypothetical protein
MSTLSGSRYSKSGEESRKAELERIKQLTPLQRIERALALGRSWAELLRVRAEG